MTSLPQSSIKISGYYEKWKNKIIHLKK